MFLLGIHHVARIRRIRCRMGPPPPPWISFPRIKYHMIKVSHLWDFSPPPPPKTSRTCCPNSIYGICVGGDLPWDFFRGEGLPYGIISLGKLCYGISSGGRFAIWYSFRGNVCHMVLFQRGQSPMVFVPLSWNLCGGRFTIEGKLYHMVLFPPGGSSAIGFLPGEGLPYGIPSGGRGDVCHMV